MPKDSIVILNPALNEEEDVLYFVSNMADSKGLDIWFVEKNEDNEWGYPQRIGREVNSSADEDMPYVREDGKVVFSSNRRTYTSSPESEKYDVYIYDPTKGRRSYLLTDYIKRELKQQIGRAHV